MTDQGTTAPATRSHGPGLRAQFVSAVAQATAEAKMALGPACYDMIDRAQSFVLNGTVQQLDATTYTVDDRGDTYTLNGRCPCPDWGPAHPHCRHLIAATLWRMSWTLVKCKTAQRHASTPKPLEAAVREPR